MDCNISSLPILVTLTLLCLLELVQGQQTLHQNTMNDCEVMLPGGTITYEVCHSANLFLLHNGAFNWTMTPEDSTCGEQQAEEYCTPVRSQLNCINYTGDLYFVILDLTLIFDRLSLMLVGKSKF